MGGSVHKEEARQEGGTCEEEPAVHVHEMPGRQASLRNGHVQAKGCCSWIRIPACEASSCDDCQTQTRCFSGLVRPCMQRHAAPPKTYCLCSVVWTEKFRERGRGRIL